MKNDFSSVPLTGVLLILLLAPGIWLLHSMRALDTIDGWLYDAIVRYAPFPATTRAEVLLLEIPPGRSPGNDELHRLLRQLQNAEAGLIIFSHFPVNAQTDFYRAAAQAGNVLFGRALLDPHARLPVQSPLPPAAAGVPLTTGIDNLPSPHAVTSREHRLRFETAAGSLDTLERVALQRLRPDLEAPTGRYRIHYRAAPLPLPRIPLPSALADGLLQDLVRGRAVLVGHAASPDLPGLRTPLSGAESVVSALEFHAYALNTLLQQAEIRELPATVIVFLLLLVTAVNLYTYRAPNLARMLWSTASLIFLYLALATGLLLTLRLWLPTGALVTLQVLVFLLILRHHWILQQEAQQALLLDASARIQGRLGGNRHFYVSDEHWQELVTLVTQTLNLRRMIFLERIPGDHRLREIVAHNCSIEDIEERRRDYQRTPYSTAIEANGPIVLKYRYLKPDETSKEQEYLTSLRSDGYVLGFWAFTLDRETDAQEDGEQHFLEIIRDYAEQISELLYQRHQWQRREKSLNHPLRRYFSLQDGQCNLQRLRHAIGLIERRLDTNEMVLNTSNTAMIVYDLFGRVMQTNRAMEKLLQQDNLPVYNLNALDLLCRLSHLTVDQARQSLRFVVRQQKAVSFVGRIEALPRYRFMLRLHPILWQAERSSMQPTVAPFQVSGILFELLDITALKNLWTLKEKVLERVYFQFRNDLESFEMARYVLHAPDISREDQQEVVGLLQEKLEQTAAIITSTQQYIQADLDIQTNLDFLETDTYPLDSLPLLKQVIDHYQPQAHQRDIQLHTKWPTVLALVFAEQQELENLFTCIMALLLEDAGDESTIRVEVREADSKVWFCFTNNGFGLPNERLQDYLFSDTASVSESFQPLRAALPWVEKWRGRLSAYSEPGQGLRFEIYLPVLI